MATILLFISWYYQDLPKKAFDFWKNFLWFWGYYFSLKDLLLSLFSPWKRVLLKYKKGSGISEWFSVLVINLFSRFIGMIFRLVLILVGLLFELLTFLFAILFFLLWPLFPFILIGLFAFGISLLF
jgi:hypothetical protein